MKITNKTLRLMQWVVSLGAMIALVLVVRNFYIQRLPSVSINNVKIRTILATTPDQRKQGLSDSSTLKPHTGMLFVYQSKEFEPFWNIHMRYPIDVVWIMDDQVIGTATLDAQTTDQTQTIYPPQFYNRVLELPRGTVDELGVTRGTRIDYVNINTPTT